MELSPEKLPDRIAQMKRSDLIELLGQLECTFTLDFTPEYLESVSVPQLQHIVAAAACHATNGEFVCDRFRPAVAN